jgi:hypothetical protein
MANATGTIRLQTKGNPLADGAAPRGSIVAGPAGMLDGLVNVAEGQPAAVVM